MSEIKKRNEMDPKYTWATEDMYVSDEAFQKDFEVLKEMAKEGLTFKGKLGESSSILLDYFKKSDAVSLKLENLFEYASRKSDENTKNPTYQAMIGSVYSYFVEFESEMAFVTPELLAISDETLEKFFAENEDLKLYKRAINEVRRRRAHILSDKEERILAAANDMAQGPEKIYSMFSDADLTFPDVKNEKGENASLTQGTFISLLESNNRDVRKNTFETYYKVMDNFKNTAASTYDAQVKSLMFNAKMRNYNSTLEAALDGTDVPVAVYKNLVDAVHKNMHHMHKYVKLRKKLMKVDELHMYDLYTSVVPNVDTKVDFETAKKNVYDAVAPLGKDYQDILKTGFDNRWIDVYENEGKRSGAYSAGAKVHPYVLLNFHDSLDNEFTLAHEMGHALHSYHSNKYQPTVYADYRIFVAEVASTFNEALLMEHLLETTTDKMERAALINHFLDQFKGTIYRQTMFAEFEMITNEMAERGEALTAEALSNVYYDLNKQYFGEDMIIDKDIALEWARIPHFYYNFYVFQYATGYSAAIALSRKVLDEGEEAVKNYKKFLSGGSSASPIDLLKIAGVDMSSPEPINQALSLFGKLIDELDELLSE